MTADEYEKLPLDEKEHFFQCPECLPENESARRPHRGRFKF
jgi:hypothetical protein